MGAFTGAGSLLRLALRRDRIKLPIWIIAIALTAWITVASSINVYGKTIQEEQLYARTTAGSVVSRVFGGPIHGPQVGEIAMNETYLFVAVLIAFMSTLAVIRHTRQNEETGREELISSGVVGRHASLMAAMVVVVGANVILGGIIAVAFRSGDLPLNGSIAAGTALAGVGVVFGAIAAIGAQVAESARGANSIAGAAIGIAFLLRALGDGIGKLTPDKMGIESAWPSWLSPLGWGQQMHAFSAQRWWWLGLFGVFFILAAGAAFWLNAVRDQGLGMIPARRGPATASRWLLSPLGLAWRLQRGTLRGWAIGIITGGVSVGLVAEEFKSLFADNPDLMNFFGGRSGGNVTDLLFAAMFGFTALAIAGYAIQSLLRVRSEEAAGHLEPILATSVSRTRWFASHVLCVMVGVVVLFALFGASTGLTYMAATGATWAEAQHLMLAVLAYIPAAVVMSGVACFMFGTLPRLVVPIAWSVLAINIFIAQFGSLLKLQQWVQDISPFSHTPAAPAESVTFVPIATLTAIAFVLIIGGFLFFRRRDATAS